MSVAGHLSIEVGEYDARIRTFVPDYERMIATVADVVRLLEVESPTIVDLGVGTGALSACCLDARPDAELIGIDADPVMLELARARLSHHPLVTLAAANFLDKALPPCDAIVACIALHHVPTESLKRRLYRALHRTLSPGGMFVSADCFPAKDPRLAAEQRRRWLAHLEQTYAPEESASHLASWADEDTYFALEDELDWLHAAGFAPEIVWRGGAFAVVAGVRGDA